METLFTEDDIISTYSAGQAVEDGFLTPTTDLVPDEDLAAQAGYKWPVRLSRRVVELVTPPTSNKIQSINGRLWDVLNVARWAVRRTSPEQTRASFIVRLGRCNIQLWACLDGTSGPAIHIITPEEY